MTLGKKFSGPLYHFHDPAPSFQYAYSVLLGWCNLVLWKQINSQPHLDRVSQDMALPACYMTRSRHAAVAPTPPPICLPVLERFHDRRENVRSLMRNPTFSLSDAAHPYYPASDVHHICSTWSSCAESSGVVSRAILPHHPGGIMIEQHHGDHVYLPSR